MTTPTLASVRTCVCVFLLFLLFSFFFSFLSFFLRPSSRTRIGGARELAMMMMTSMMKGSFCQLLSLALFLSAGKADPGPANYSLLDPVREGALLRPSATAGAEALVLQNVLAGVCFKTGENPLSGTFDAATEAALAGFQRHVNLSDSGESGLVGPLTMEAFDVALGIHAAASPGLLRITDEQVTPDIAAGAEAILKKYWNFDVGTLAGFLCAVL